MLVRSDKFLLHIDHPGSCSPGLYSYVSMDANNIRECPWGGIPPKPTRKWFTIRKNFIYVFKREFPLSDLEGYNPDRDGPLDTADFSPPNHVVVRGSA